MTPVVNLDTREVVTFSSLCTAHPVAPNSPNEDYLFPQDVSLEQALRWWNDLQRIDYNGKTYTVLEGSTSQPGNELDAIAVCMEDHQLYRLSIGRNEQEVIPVSNIDKAERKLSHKPLFGLNKPMVYEPVE